MNEVAAGARSRNRFFGKTPTEPTKACRRRSLSLSLYTIPRDNPFFGWNTAKQEIWAYGLRSPFRASFDRMTGDLDIGDVGDTLREEVDFNSAKRRVNGQNFG